MAMGIVSDSDFESELRKHNPEPPIREEKKDNTHPPFIVELPTNGRKEGDVNVPNSLRQLIGQTAIESGRSEALELAKRLGISPSSVSAYSNGATSTASYDDTPNKPVINSARERIAKKARAKLVLALSHLTEEKLQGAKARDLSGIAKDMSFISKNMEDNIDPNTNKNNGPMFVIYSPQMKREDTFEVVQAKE
jgi:predicted transcriptional regulator